MAKRIAIQLGAEIAVAEMLWDQAPNLCKGIWDALPIECPAHHAKICNHEIMYPAPMVGLPRENPTVPRPGDVGYWTARNTITIWYDDTVPLGPTGLFAKIVQNLEGFKKEALKTWIKQGTMMRISRLE